MNNQELIAKLRELTALLEAQAAGKQLQYSNPVGWTDIELFPIHVAQQIMGTNKGLWRIKSREPREYFINTYPEGMVQTAFFKTGAIAYPSREKAIAAVGVGVIETAVRFREVIE